MTTEQQATIDALNVLLDAVHAGWMKERRLRPWTSWRPEPSPREDALYLLMVEFEERLNALEAAAEAEERAS